MPHFSDQLIKHSRTATTDSSPVGMEEVTRSRQSIKRFKSTVQLSRVPSNYRPKRVVFCSSSGNLAV